MCSPSALLGVWHCCAQYATAESATHLGPQDGRESATLQTLAPGSYTAIVQGKDDTKGVGLVEVYALN
jgi:hypothetical protein